MNIFVFFMLTNMQDQLCLCNSCLFIQNRYYRDAGAALLVYDITDASSFKDLKFWIDELD